MARMLGLRSSGTTIPNSRHYASIIQRCGDCITTRFRSAYDIMTDRDLRDGFVELPYDLILAWAGKSQQLQQLKNTIMSQGLHVRRCCKLIKKVVKQTVFE